MHTHINIIPNTHTHTSTSHIHIIFHTNIFLHADYISKNENLLPFFSANLLLNFRLFCTMKENGNAENRI